MEKNITVLQYIMIFYFFSSLRPIIHYSSGYIYCYTLHKVPLYIQTFKQPIIIKYMPCTHTNKTQAIINYIVTIITLNKHSKLSEQQEIP